MKTTILIALSFMLVGKAYSQNVHTSSLEVSDKKTVHIVFPKPAVYIDLGSHDILAGRVDWAENVIRVKAAVNNFENETTFSVMTADNKLYTFIVSYNRDPHNLNIVIEDSDGRGQPEEATPDIKITKAGVSSPGELSEVIDRIYRADRQLSPRKRARSHGIDFFLKGLYTHGDAMIFHLAVRNTTNIAFDKDFICFVVTDRKVARRTPVQSIILDQVATGGDGNKIGAGRTANYIVVIPKITLPDNRQLNIELGEQNGGRYLKLIIKNKILYNVTKYPGK